MTGGAGPFLIRPSRSAASCPLPGSPLPTMRGGLYSPTYTQRSTVCGCSGSTTGGVKSDRMYIAFKSIGRQIKQNLHPSSIMQIRVGNHFLKDNAVFSAILYIVLYTVVLIISIVLLVLCGVDAHEAVSGALSSLGNAGPALDSISTMG